MNRPDANADSLSVAALCRLDDAVVRVIRSQANSSGLVRTAGLAILAGTLCYGFVFGLWRSPLQAVLSALKMPLLLVAVTLTSGLINGMLAQVLGTGLSFRQVLLCILVNLAIASLILGALSPVMLFLVLQLPSQDSPDAMLIYRTLLPAHTIIVAIAGIIGCARLIELLRMLTGSAHVARLVFLCWISVSGLTGIQLSWMISPFLARPGESVPIINPNAFARNVFEYLAHTVTGGKL